MFTTHRLVLGCIAIATVNMAFAQAVRLHRYQDRASGVTLSYSNRWQASEPSQKDPDYFSTLLEHDEQHPALILSYRPRPSQFAHSTFAGLTFLYLSKPSPTAADCREQGSLGSLEDEHRQTLTINGVKYRHTSGGDVGASQHRNEDVYTTWHHGVCSLFIHHLETVAPGVSDGVSDPTKAEWHEMEGQFDRLMASIRIH